ncbi:MAG TPA: NifU family protein [Phaeodactylibacter sp.]|nr:NifU family protein [Phaeodactylibacter sp.]
MIQKVEDALQNVRPHLQVDGGDIEIVDITDDMAVKLRWLGNCEHCSMSAMTMRAGVEESIRAIVPEITKVEAINGL